MQSIIALEVLSAVSENGFSGCFEHICRLENTKAMIIPAISVSALFKNKAYKKQEVSCGSVHKFSYRSILIRSRLASVLSKRLRTIHL